MSSLTVFVLCHNRPDFARQTLRSILQQTGSNFDLVISDNSSNDEVQKMVASEFPEIEYRRRVPMLPPAGHFNRCLEEVEADYFCLFHDDDLMLPGFVQRARSVLDKYPEVVACGCNALLELHGITDKKMFRTFGELEYITSPRDLAQRYFARAQSGIAPFPGYVYRRNRVRELRFDADGGKYGDVSWLLRITLQGPIAWIAEPMMIYRVHGGNDSGIDSLRDHLRLLGCLKQQAFMIGEDVLTDFRRSQIYKPILKNETASPFRRNHAERFLKRYNWLRYTNIRTYGALLRHVFIKLVAR